MLYADNLHDDTAAIQSAIDFAAKRGGGKIMFPYTPTGYRIASPAIEEIDGKPVRAQLVIPAGRTNIQLEGEMPCRMLYSYQVRPLSSAKKNSHCWVNTPPAPSAPQYSVSLLRHASFRRKRSPHVRPFSAPAALTAVRSMY